MFFSHLFRVPALTGGAGKTAAPKRSTAGRIEEVGAFGSNPGALRMLVYAPSRLRAGRPLVVVLHGCRQDAAGFANEAGWVELAQRCRLSLLLPEQRYENNRGRCFNWFRPDDVRRGKGEAMSIRQMVAASVKRFGADPRQIFIAGFSAGGGMTAALLATYPAVFAAGAVVAGMPFGCAQTPLAALRQMHRANTWRNRKILADDVRIATRATKRRKWPRLSIWHGERDRTVDPGNAQVLADQWCELHGFGPEPLSDESGHGIRRRAWGQYGRPPSVELWTLAELGHGFPLDPQAREHGRPGPWVVNAGLSGVGGIASFWGLDAAQVC